MLSPLASAFSYRSPPKRDHVVVLLGVGFGEAEQARHRRGRDGRGQVPDDVDALVTVDRGLRHHLVHEPGHEVLEVRLDLLALVERDHRVHDAPHLAVPRLDHGRDVLVDVGDVVLARAPTEVVDGGQTVVDGVVGDRRERTLEAGHRDHGAFGAEPAIRRRAPIDVAVEGSGLRLVGAGGVSSHRPAIS